ncbi:hypothetical protein BLNAU_12828 [Blattamonas nauphoetae]|uniref:B30.2/SPRY domain-containing protein n=1 Tax=Blattamonas nauphoetae TaxID=2049346 RepID=A0ABQ9XN98_9EUKA|nr:hypothetical protein BLNAU_12828 [Blattamonas nauphoetae]
MLARLTGQTVVNANTDSAFRNWSENNHDSIDEKAALFQSLVAMAKDPDLYDSSLEMKAVKFLNEIVIKDDEEPGFPVWVGFMPSRRHVPQFVESVKILLSLPNQQLVTASMEFLRSLVVACSPFQKLALVDHGLVSNIMSALKPTTLTFPEADDIHLCLMDIVHCLLWLSTPSGLDRLEFDEPSEQVEVREAVFEEVVGASEGYLFHLCTHHTSLAIAPQCSTFVVVLHQLVRIGGYHRPALDFTLSLPLATTITGSLPTSVNDITNGHFLDLVCQLTRFRTENGVDAKKEMKAELVGLFSEGFQEIVERRCCNQIDETSRGTAPIDPEETPTQNDIFGLETEHLNDMTMGIIKMTSLICQEKDSNQTEDQTNSLSSSASLLNRPPLPLSTLPSLDFTDHSHFSINRSTVTRTEFGTENSSGSTWSSLLLSDPFSSGIISFTITILSLPDIWSDVYFGLVDSNYPIPAIGEELGFRATNSVGLSLNGNLYSNTPSSDTVHNCHSSLKEGDCVRMEVDLDSTPRTVQFFVNGEAGRCSVSGIPSSVRIGLPPPKPKAGPSYGAKIQPKKKEITNFHRLSRLGLIGAIVATVAGISIPTVIGKLSGLHDDITQRPASIASRTMPPLVTTLPAALTHLSTIASDLDSDTLPLLTVWARLFRLDRLLRKSDLFVFESQHDSDRYSDVLFRLQMLKTFQNFTFTADVVPCDTFEGEVTLTNIQVTDTRQSMLRSQYAELETLSILMNDRPDSQCLPEGIQNRLDDIRWLNSYLGSASHASDIANATSLLSTFKANVITHPLLDEIMSEFDQTHQQSSTFSRTAESDKCFTDLEDFKNSFASVVPYPAAYATIGPVWKRARDLTRILSYNTPWSRRELAKTVKQQIVPGNDGKSATFTLMSDTKFEQLSILTDPSNFISFTSSSCNSLKNNIAKFNQQIDHVYDETDKRLFQVALDKAFRFEDEYGTENKTRKMLNKMLGDAENLFSAISCSLNSTEFVSLIPTERLLEEQQLFRSRGRTLAVLQVSLILVYVLIIELNWTCPNNTCLCCQNLISTLHYIIFGFFLLVYAYLAVFTEDIQDAIYSDKPGLGLLPASESSGPSYRSWEEGPTEMPNPLGEPLDAMLTIITRTEFGTDNFGGFAWSSALLSNPYTSGIISFTTTILTLPAFWADVYFGLTDYSSPIPKLGEELGFRATNSVSLSTDDRDCVRIIVDLDSTPRTLQFFVNGEAGTHYISGIPSSVRIGFSLFGTGTSFRIDNISRLSRPIPISEEVDKNEL